MLLCKCADVTEEVFKKVLLKRRSCSKETIRKVEDRVGAICTSCLPRMKEIVREALYIELNRDNKNSPNTNEEL